MVPGSSAVSCVEDFGGIGDEVGTVVGMSVHVVGDESVFWVELFPGVSFVARLPDIVIPELDEQS